VHKSVITAHPEADLAITVVWTDRWPMDGSTTARRSAELIGPKDPRVQQFHESGREIGKVVARSLGWDDPENDETAAWDIYLFWPAGVRWDDTLPPPTITLHQLSNHRDEAEFRTGDALVLGLDEATIAIVGKGGS
jgi:hypothetical protein